MVVNTADTRFMIVHILIFILFQKSRMNMMGRIYRYSKC